MLARTPWRSEPDRDDPDVELHLDGDFGRAVMQAGAWAAAAVADRQEHGSIHLEIDTSLTDAVLKVVEYFEGSDLTWSAFHAVASLSGYRIWWGRFLEQIGHKRWAIPDDVGEETIVQAIKWALALTKMHADRRARRESEEALAARMWIMTPEEKSEFASNCCISDSKPVQ